MITFQVTTEVKEDHRVLLTLPPEVPTGPADLVVTVEFPTTEKKLPQTPYSSSKENEPLREGGVLNRYPLRGSVIRYDDPTEPVSEGDWEALR